MALDQIPNTGKHMRFKILGNIGSAFFRLGQFRDALQSYETIMGGQADSVTAFHMILCYFALGDTEKMMRGFQRLVAIPLHGALKESDITINTAPSTEVSSRIQFSCVQHGKILAEGDVSSTQMDKFIRELQRRNDELHAYIYMAGRLIAPELKSSDDDSVGYKVITDTLRADHERYERL